jgi:hypothetical protein
MKVFSLTRSFYILFVSTVTLMIVALGGALGAFAAERAPQRVQSYGPTPPVVTPPGGFSVVITSRTITPAGGVIGPVLVGRADATLTIPAGAFPVPVQITLTAPGLAAFGTAGVRGYRTVGGIGIQVQEDGSPYPGSFRKPVTVTLRSRQITSGSIVQTWNGRAFVTDTGATVDAGDAVTAFDSDPYFLVLSPRRFVTRPFPVPPAPVAGEPLPGEGIAVIGLSVLGLIGLDVYIGLIPG